ncbi:hypothetical protein Daes_0563 [Pseudodesulfovibrio aespoeensis Aspo-2]|uniref:Uncharacterized protein n=1 Tax=Pseudodesulfovibrio aespoeensis (strain ATCC 700646 / DSM 10631 / Aspo-2) TaxID=643562 RepID=E6VYC5_PSEA9|nr:hypothetical protein [Pseudodesulfovibrio aespoeensis]ADU61583.1 hypothetical protein Daes_0563 [Pseudodesulfovibrio aespoeensis Aspo-2]
MKCANRATLSGPKSKQYRTHQNAKAFARRLRRAGLGVRKWTNITSTHFAAVARQMKDDGRGDGCIAEVFPAARDDIKVTAGHSPARRDVSDACLGNSH